jgi:hypothetical protein
LTAPQLTLALRSFSLMLFALDLGVAFAGPGRSESNLAPYALYAIFWVGLVPASLIFGPVWRRLNPLRLLHSGLCRLTRTDPDTGLRQLPAQAGLWPAAGVLALFVWVELVFPYRAVPVLVGLFILLYAVLTVFLAMLFGRKWFSAGDAFEVYSTLAGSLSPFGQRDDGAPVIRNPLTGLSAVAGTPGLTGVAAVLVGSTAFDGLTRTRFWMDRVAPESVLLGTAALFGLIAVVGALLYAAARLSTNPTWRGSERKFTPPAAPAQFAPALVPVALGCVMAHHFSFMVFEGQVAIALASAPFRLGWDLFGTSGRPVDYLLVGPLTIGWIQMSAIVIGHIVGLTTAHDRALALTGSRGYAIRSQIPIAVLMITLTLSGVLLLVSA